VVPRMVPGFFARHAPAMRSIVRPERLLLQRIVRRKKNHASVKRDPAPAGLHAPECKKV
jgi:hypothetical protein